jgi:hypothetical protein
MPRRRLLLGLAFAASAFTLVVGQSATTAQPPAPAKAGVRDGFFLESPLWPPDLRSKVFEWKNGEKEMLVKSNPKAAKDLELLAKIIIYKVTDRKYFTPSIEQKVGFGKNEQNVIANPETDQTMDGVMIEINRYVLVPKSSEKSPYFQVEYIQEFGKATDVAIRDVLKKAGNDPKAAIVRVNAGRALASVCRSGATAHVPLLIDLIKNESTPTELQYWALKAAENLIDASDIIRAVEGRPEFHALKDPDLAQLVNVLENAITRYSAAAMPPAAPATPPPSPPPVPKGPPPAGAKVPPTTPAAPPAPPVAPAPPQGGKIETAIVTQFEPGVALYLRKQAVRAVSKCRKVHVSDATRTLARPGLILARFAVGDPSVVPPAQPYECADAAVGLARMVPDGKVNLDVYLDAVAASIANFGAWKVTGFESKEAKVVLWKKNATALQTALVALKGLPEKSPAAVPFRQKLNSLADLAQREIVEPIKTEAEGVAATAARPDEVNRWRAEPANQRATDQLLKDDPQSRVLLPRAR